MNIFSRRNAIVGYLALQALKRARRNATVGYLAAQGVEHTRARRRGGRALRISLYAALGIVSVGVLAAAARFWRQQAGATSAGPGEAVGRAADAAVEPAAAEPAEEAAPAALEQAPAT